MEMRSYRVVRILSVVFAVFGAAMATAVAQTVETPAEYAVIMDYRTGEILYEKNARVPTAPASMSKLMTAAIVFEKLKTGDLKLTDMFDVSEKAWRMRGSKMWVRVDTEISVENLLRGIIVQSGNDACIVVAENIAGSEEAFAALMNQKAREWKLLDSTFSNASGWPDENQKMSMRDLALLTRKIIRDFPEYYGLFAEREFTWEKIRQENRNALLDTFSGADGLKTGHTEESGYGLVGSAVKDDERRIVVLNGLESNRARTEEAARMMRIAFNDYSRVTLYEPGDLVGEAMVFKGKQKTAPLMVAEPVNAIVHRQLKDNTKATVVYNGPVAAPIAANQQIGYLRVEIDGGATKEYPLYAARGVREMGVFGKIGLGAKTLLAKPDKSSAETASALQP